MITTHRGENRVDTAGHTEGTAIIKPGYDPRLTNEDLAPLRKQTWGTLRPQPNASTSR